MSKWLWAQPHLKNQVVYLLDLLLYVLQLLGKVNHIRVKPCFRAEVSVVLWKWHNKKDID